MSELSELYQEMILDHNRNPRNFGKMGGSATHAAIGDNPLCGDHYSIELRVKDDRIAEINFQGAGCAISKASASMLTESVRGRSISESQQLIDIFHKTALGEQLTPTEEAELGKLTVFAGVSEFPMRIKCATLAWHTLKAALSGNQHVTTE